MFASWIPLNVLLLKFRNVGFDLWIVQLRHLFSEPLVDSPFTHLLHPRKKDVRVSASGPPQADHRATCTEIHVGTRTIDSWTAVDRCAVELVGGRLVAWATHLQREDFRTVTPCHSKRVGLQDEKST